MQLQIQRWFSRASILVSKFRRCFQQIVSTVPLTPTVSVNVLASEHIQWNMPRKGHGLSELNT